VPVVGPDGVHAYVPLGRLTVDVSVPELPLQIAIELGKLTVGTGLTVTVDELGKLGQPFNVYTTE
jgi:hypothetical protein